MTNRRFGPYVVELSREEKILFPDSGISKGDLIHYYAAMAGSLLPHVRGRPLTLHRFPDGIGGDGFFQKAVPDHFPEWIPRVRVDLEEGGHQEQVVARNAATLVYLANQGSITPHVWLSRADALEKPDRIVFDLDPAGTDFGPVRTAANLLRRLLTDLGLTPHFMTTGSTGGHVWVPIRRGPTFDEARAFARAVVERLADAHPEDFTTEARKDRRGGRLYLDSGRNAYGQTATAPYAVRPLPGAPVATPLAWDELEAPGLRSTSYDLHSVPRRLGQRPDPWKGMGRHGSSLSKAGKQLQETGNEEHHA